MLQASSKIKKDCKNYNRGIITTIINNYYRSNNSDFLVSYSKPLNQMKQVILPLLFLLPFAGISQLDTSSKKYNVRKCKWGMTQAQVKETESLKPFKADDKNLYYNVEVDGYKFKLSYEFESDKLVSATLIYDQTHLDKQTFWNTFEKIGEKLDGKYGNHTDLTKWRNDRFKNSESSYGYAASKGDVSFNHVWHTDKTTISLIMSGEDYEIMLSVVYRDSNHESKETEFKPQP
jgi:hypothetical protein